MCLKQYFVSLSCPRTNNGAKAYHSYLNAEFYVKHPNICMFVDALKKVQQTAYVAIDSLLRPASVGLYPSMNEKKDSLLLLHIMTITHTFSQDSSTLEKCVIVMGLGSICETVVYFRVCYPRDAMLARVIGIATCHVSLAVTRRSKQRKIASWFLHHLVAPWLLLSDAKFHPSRHSKGSPP